MPLILTVCTANVCRSPLAQGVLGQKLAGASDLEFASAGSLARNGDHLCELSSAELGSKQFTLAHRSRRVDESIVRSADLILTAEMENRAAIGRLVPGARARTFTLVEAVFLSTTVDELRRRQLSAPIAPPLEEDLTALVSRLHGARGLAQMQPPARTFRDRLTGSEIVNPFDIVDGHALSKQRHAEALRKVRSTTEHFAAWIDTNLA